MNEFMSEEESYTSVKILKEETCLKVSYSFKSWEGPIDA